MSLYEKEGHSAPFLGPCSYTCPKCGTTPTKKYCSACDLYYNECECAPEPGGWDDHKNCRY